MSDAAIRARVFGRVQGVGYRAWTVERATALGLKGWVRNREDGSVELSAVGEAQAVEALLEACRSGPRFAVVTRIETMPEPDGTAPADFRQIR